MRNKKAMETLPSNLYKSKDWFSVSNFIFLKEDFIFMSNINVNVTDNSKTIEESTLNRINEILLRRKNVFFIPTANWKDTEPLPQAKATQLIATINANIMSYGYSIDGSTFDALIKNNVSMSREMLTFVYSSMSAILSVLTGGNLKYKPMYPNFPAQVMEMDECELYINAIVHYMTFGEWLPEYEEKTRLPLPQKDSLKPVQIVFDLKYLSDILMNLLSSPTSLSEQDKEDIGTIYDIASRYDWCIGYGCKLQSPLYMDYSKVIVFKETRAFMQKILADRNADFYRLPIVNMCETITDVLRMAVAFSDGDVSLAEISKFKKFTRAERRLILGAIETILIKRISNKVSPIYSMTSSEDLFEAARESHSIDYIIEEMFLHREQFLRLGEIVHPGTEKYRKQFPFTACLYDVLRNEKVSSYYGKIDAAIANKDTKELVRLLSSRPGEFARRLDMLLRKNIVNSKTIITEFNRVATQVSNNVLYQVLAHFTDIGTNLNHYSEPRIFFPKGQVAKAYVKANTNGPIEMSNVYQIINICNNAIMKSYLNRDYMGLCYVNPALKNFVMPFSQRSASSASRVLTRGSRMKLDDSSNVIRGFVHWTNLQRGDHEERVDIDLSAAFYDENFNYVTHISYTNLRNDFGCSSGDITNGGSPDGDGVAEFIDIDLNAFTNHKLADRARYVVFQVYSYTNQPFDTMPRASFGWMEREDADFGEIFEPSTVVNKMKLTAKTTVSIPVIFDLQTREFIWADLATGISNRGMVPNNVETNLRGTSLMLYATVNMHKTSVFDVVSKNVKARGSFTHNMEEADIIFDLEKGTDETKKYITPYDVDELMALI